MRLESSIPFRPGQSGSPSSVDRVDATEDGVRCQRGRRLGHQRLNLCLGAGQGIGRGQLLIGCDHLHVLNANKV
jgi:hypothetical protein